MASARCVKACKGICAGVLGQCNYRLSTQVYDLNGDGFISREEILQWLKGSLVKQSHEDDTDESIKELMDIIMKKLDVVDHDNKVSFNVSICPAHSPPSISLVVREAGERPVSVLPTSIQFRFHRKVTKCSSCNCNRNALLLCESACLRA